MFVTSDSLRSFWLSNKLLRVVTPYEFPLSPLLEGDVEPLRRGEKLSYTVSVMLLFFIWAETSELSTSTVGLGN